MDEPVSFKIAELYNVEGLTVVITGGGTGLGKGKFVERCGREGRHRGGR